MSEPLFERGFIHDSYANRAGKGTHRAVARYERFRDRFRHVLRCDIYRYFPAIDHEILKRDLRRRIACPRTLALADRIVDGSNPQEPVPLYYPGDDLFTPFERRRGRGAGVRTCAGRPRALAVTGPQHDTHRQFGLHLNRRTPTRRENSGYWNPIGAAASSSGRCGWDDHGDDA